MRSTFSWDITRGVSRPAEPCPSSPGFDLSVDQVEVGLVVRAVLRLLPAAGDRVPLVLEPAGEALGEGRALAPEPPLAVADAHLVDAADASIVGVELVVAPVRGVASHDRDSVGRLGHLHRRPLDQVRAGVMPLDRGPRLARPGFAARRDRLQRPLPDQRLQLLQRLLRGGLIHPAPSSTPPAGRSGLGRRPSRRSSPYAPGVVESAWPPRSLFSGTNLLAMKVAPCGSVMKVILTQGASNGGTTTWPPSCAALSAVASASSTAKVTFQCAATSGWSSAIGLSVATKSSKPSGAPLSAIRSRSSGSLCCRK